MEFLEFIQKVETSMRGSGEAERAVMAVFETLGERLSGGEASDIAAQLPEEFRGPLESASGEPESFGVERFFERVVEKEGVNKNTATGHARTVMAVLGQAITSGELGDVRSQLPQEFHPLLQG